MITRLTFLRFTFSWLPELCVFKTYIFLIAWLTFSRLIFSWLSDFCIKDLHFLDFLTYILSLHFLDFLTYILRLTFSWFLDLRFRESLEHRSVVSFTCLILKCRSSHLLFGYLTYIIDSYFLDETYIFLTTWPTFSRLAFSWLPDLYFQVLKLSWYLTLFKTYIFFDYLTYISQLTFSWCFHFLDSKNKTYIFLMPFMLILLMWAKFDIRMEERRCPRPSNKYLAGIKTTKSII